MTLPSSRELNGSLFENFDEPGSLQVFAEIAREQRCVLGDVLAV